jgi:hypothetical protein
MTSDWQLVGHAQAISLAYNEQYSEAHEVLHIFKFSSLGTLSIGDRLQIVQKHLI